VPDGFLEGQNGSIVLQRLGTLLRRRIPFRDVESVLLVPVPAAESAVGPWRALHDPSAAAGAPPHVTLVYPFLSPARITPRVLEELAEIVRARPAFEFSLAGLCAFPAVLYAAPEPADPFIALTQAIGRLFPEAPPYGGAFSRVIPHLTLAHLPESSAVGGRPDSLLTSLGEILPISCRADEVWLMVRGRRWRLRARFGFGPSERAAEATKEEMAWA
jgi:2'-5' RNA ligase